MIGIVLFIILAIISFLYDASIVISIEKIRNSILDYLLLSIAFASNIFIIFFFLTTLFLWQEHKRRWILPLWFSGILAGLISVFLKIIIHRKRPFHEGIVSVLGIIFHFMKSNFNTWNFSFPSFETMLVFAAVPILYKEFKNFRYIWIVFACLVGFTRVYFGVHYLSDVLAGALFGYLIGYLMVLAEEKYEIGKKAMRMLRL